MRYGYFRAVEIHSTPGARLFKTSNGEFWVPKAQIKECKNGDFEVEIHRTFGADQLRTKMLDSLDDNDVGYSFSSSQHITPPEHRALPAPKLKPGFIVSVEDGGSRVIAGEYKGHSAGAWVPEEDPHPLNS